MKEPEKRCKYCDKVIKGKPKIYDDYYFCDTDCLRGDLETPQDIFN